MTAPRRPVLVACLLLACARPDAERGGPRLTVEWSGADTAAFAAPATAERCDTLRLLEIRAISGDTGLGLALYDTGGFGSGLFPIRPPGAADSVPPAAALGVRWFSQTAVQGFQGDSGEVFLRREPNGSMSGRFKASAHAISGTGRLALTGTFTGLRMRPAGRGCAPSAPAPAPPAADSAAGVD